MNSINKASLNIGDPIKKTVDLAKTGANIVNSSTRGLINTGTSSVKKTYSDSRTTGIIALVVFLGFIIVVLIWGLKKAYKDSYDISTDRNIIRIKTEQKLSLEKRWIGVKQGKAGLENVSSREQLNNVVLPIFGNANPNGTSMSQVPRSELLLINFPVFSTRLTGYCGPFYSGVFDEDFATRAALNSGSRCMVLEIDRLSNSYEPILTYRDGWGIKQSLNEGSIKNVAKSLAGRVFSNSNDGPPPNCVDDPFFLVIYFVSTPLTNTSTKEHIRFMAKVAEQLQPLKDLIIGITPQGDFRRQALESQLFFKDYGIFTKKIIMLTNADTSPFRDLEKNGLAGEIAPHQDLDLLVHVRLYSLENPSKLGITTGPSTNKSPSAVLTTPNYWLNIPPDRIIEAVNQTKKAWTIVMNPIESDSTVLTKDEINRLFMQFGVNSVPICIFDKPQKTDLYTGPNAPFENHVWRVKSEPVRFIPPKPIAVQKPFPEANAGGGAVSTPTFQ